MVADGDGGCGFGLIGLIWVGVEVWWFGLISAALIWVCVEAWRCGGVEVWVDRVDLGMCGLI